MIKYVIIQENLHYETKYFHNKAFESSKDSPWLNYVDIGLELVSPKKNYMVPLPAHSTRASIVQGGYINKYHKCL